MIIMKWNLSKIMLIMIWEYFYYIKKKKEERMKNKKERIYRTIRTNYEKECIKWKDNFTIFSDLK